MPIKVNNEEYFNTDETARYLGVSKQTVHNLVSQGTLKQYKQGIRKLVYYKKTDLDDILSMHQVEDDKA
jgi:excisionase family DNA binding protein